MPSELFPSPYAFVPFGPIVVLLPESDTSRISHDLPFADGLSGAIEITLTARTPVFVGAGEKRQWLKVPSKGSSKPDRHVIPGDSLRGCIRAITEMATFSKAGFIEDRHIAVRNLNSPEYTVRLTETRNGVFVPRTRAGWLTADGDQWWITPCDLARIEAADLERIAELPEGALAPRASAQERYEVWLENQGNLELDLLTTSDELVFTHSANPDNRRKLLRYRKAWNAVCREEAEWDLNESSSDPAAALVNRTGTLVLTGQPRKRGLGTKHMEFVFLHPSGVEPESMMVQEAVRERFLQVHGGDTDLRGQNRAQRAETAADSWKYWRAKLKGGERIPVFYLPDEDGEPADIGLAFMFRLPSPRSICKALPKPMADTRGSSHLDVSEAIFGRTPLGPTDTTAPLKGRVSFEALVATTTLKETPHTVLLQAPRPSFAPAYLRQRSPDSTTSWLSKEATIAGRKVYPARNDVAEYQGADAGKEASRCQIYPVPTGSAFSGTIHFHNLRPWELGALLWALSLGGTPGSGERWHRIGAGKPYAFGSVHLKPKLTSCTPVVANPTPTPPPTESSLMNEFRQWMQRQWLASGQKAEWEKCDAIQELLAAHVAVPENGRLFRYLFLGRGRGNNEFQNAIEEHDRLRSPRQIVSESKRKNP